MQLSSVVFRQANRERERLLLLAANAWIELQGQAKLSVHLVVAKTLPPAVWNLCFQTNAGKLKIHGRTSRTNSAVGREFYVKFRSTSPHPHGAVAIHIHRRPPPSSHLRSGRKRRYLPALARGLHSSALLRHLRLLDPMPEPAQTKVVRRWLLPPPP